MVQRNRELMGEAGEKFCNANLHCYKDKKVSKKKVKMVDDKIC